MAMACQATDNEGLSQVAPLSDETLTRWLPIDAEVGVVPIWQCTEFFDLRWQFDQLDADGTPPALIASPLLLYWWPT